MHNRRVRTTPRRGLDSPGRGARCRKSTACAAAEASRARARGLRRTVVSQVGTAFVSSSMYFCMAFIFDKSFKPLHALLAVAVTRVNGLHLVRMAGKSTPI